jgi:Nif-specific regulatory protein
VPDISKDSRFLDRTAARRADPAQPIAFICLPLKVGNETVGALSVDRPHAGGALLEKDLRLLTIVGSTVSQVVKIHRVMSVEKEKVLARDAELLGELKTRYRLDNVIGQSEAMQSVLATAAAAARSRASVLVTGETGTGKELVANVVHYNSDRAAGPFVKVNCGALPETLLESELFGHVKGSFTGALRDRQGRFELANGGTLFLDEVAEMSPRLQVKLLRVLQNGQFEPVGAERTIRVDVRVVAATNRDLRAEMAAGRFRDDLYYRVNVIPIHLPPLRERRKDIPPLIDHFLELYNAREKRQVTRLSREVLDLMLQYPWPGNVRELENCIERAVVMSPGDALSVDLLPREVVGARLGGMRGGPLRPAAEQAVRQAAADFCRSGGDLASAREQLVRVAEETAIRMGLESGLSRRRLADQLGMSRTTLRKKMRDYGID